ncbi:glycine--tRNA ligase subunit beta [Parvularcula dongshanensis]|uniref:Glycine--tRNA ligase beta subunit n=1 Tax=Parvularcula dongshanensis TaxID=1173995 RepID=A0A840I4C8_9PROT|nr:glycine--tRNA ligase subunit beta [Parvularcula dongshanensis]MBB4659719.1 glycyl-tRNA synthetase beta chain [Parvularcula dongshanensis]
MPDLLLELFSEEIPARMQRRAAADLERLMGARLREAGFPANDARAFGGPRRLTFLATGLPEKTKDRTEERKGPRVGAPEKAVEGFLRGAGLDSIDQAETREDKKGAFYVAIINEPGRPTAEVIAEAVPAIVRDFPWPKSMRWGAGELRWVRPLHRVLCTFGGEVVPFEVENGGQPIRSGDLTEGHRFMAPGEVQTRSWETYEERLRAARVVLDPDEREERVLGEARALCQAQGLALVEDQGLLAEVAGLAEWPVPRIGKFDPAFLQVPDEVLTAAMRGHQKYFSVRDPSTGRLAPRFVTVANVEPEDGGAAMMTGYERVLTARLSDALFLYRQDLKTPLEEHAERLSGITFFEGLGTIADKVDRVAALAREIAPKVGADPGHAEKAARLAKADLPTEMVGEFPELQGVMGRYYALEAGVEQDVADAIRDHYKPQGQGDEVPTAPVSVAVALADKLATLVMFWSIDAKPTGSKDPFALRRMALGAVQILLSGSLKLPLLETFGGSNADAAKDLLGFFHDRLTVYLRDQGHRHDHIAAVLTPDADDLVLVVRKLEALEAFLGTEDGANLITAYKRAANILRAEAKKGTEPSEAISPDAFAQGEEKALYDTLEEVRVQVLPALEEERFTDAMSLLSKLRGPVDAFFDEVTVVTEDETLTRNRLALLNSIKGVCERIADFSKLEG